MNLERTLDLLNKTEGRDKVCKAIQYSSRIIQWHAFGTNDQLHLMFKNLMGKLLFTRRLIKLSNNSTNEQCKEAFQIA